MSGITTLDYLSVGEVFTETTKIPADLFSRTYFINPLHFNNPLTPSSIDNYSDAAVLQLSKRDEKIVDRIKNLGSLDRDIRSAPKTSRTNVLTQLGKLNTKQDKFSIYIFEFTWALGVSRKKKE